MYAGDSSNLFRELFIGETRLDSANVSIPIRQMIEVFYKAILNRAPTEKEIDIHAYGYPVFDTPNMVSLLSSFVSSKEFVQKFSNEHKSLLTEKHQSSLINACDSYLIFPVFNEAWLPFALACCEYFFNEYSIKSLLVSEVQYESLNYALNSFSFLIGCCCGADVVNLVTVKPPAIIFVHSGIWVQLTEALIEKSNFSVFYILGDAFRNHPHYVWDSRKYISGAISWGFDDGVCSSYKKTVIDYFSIERFRTALACNIIPQSVFGVDLELYDVFYVRYWSEGGVYSGIDSDSVVRSWADTVLAMSDLNAVLIIKGDERVSSELTNKFKMMLAERGVEFIDFEDYAFQRGVNISRFGNMPVEYAYSKGLLCRARKHYVLDSSLAYVIANHPQVDKCCEIVLGVDSFLVNQFPDDCKVQIASFIEHTKNAIANSPQFVGDIDCLSPVCVRIKLY